jgi:hypothetical protein
LGKRRDTWYTWERWEREGTIGNNGNIWEQWEYLGTMGILGKDGNDGPERGTLVKIGHSFVDFVTLFSFIMGTNQLAIS